MSGRYLTAVLYGIILLLCMMIAAVFLYFKNREEALLDRLHKMLEDAVSGTLEAISNVVDNAIKYTQNGGKVSVCISNYSIFLRIDVMDNGIGIEETEQANIFSRFYRSALVSEKPGLGLGLYLTREILKAQNGYIKVSSIVGKGSNFSVYLWKG